MEAAGFDEQAVAMGAPNNPAQPQEQLAAMQ